MTPFDGGAPVIKTVHLALRRNTGTLGHGLVALNGLTLSNSTYADSFDSNPTASPTGPWLVWSAGIAQNNASVVVLAGTVSIASGARVKGNLYLGAGVTAPPGGRVTGTITPGYSLTVPFPVYPTAAGVSQSYILGATIPATLPRTGDLPAADGRYYYFTSSTVSSFTVTASRNVTVVSTAGMTITSTTQIILPTTSTLHVFMTGAFTISGTSLNSAGYAGALRIYTSTSSACSIGNSTQVTAWFHAPNAALSATGGAATNSISGCFIAQTISAANSQNYHFDDSLPVYATYDMVRYMDFQSAADKATVAGLSGNYLQ